MFNRHAPADKAGAILFEKAEPRLSALLAEHGALHPRELPPAVASEIFRRAVIETAGANFPTANHEALGHGIRSFVHPAFVPAWDQVRSSTAIGSDAFAMASGADAAVVLAGFALRIAPFDFKQGIIEEPSNDIDAVLAMFSRWTNALVGTALVMRRFTCC